MPPHPSPHTQLSKCKYIKFTYCNGIFLVEATVRKLDKYVIFQPLLGPTRLDNLTSNCHGGMHVRDCTFLENPKTSKISRFSTPKIIKTLMEMFFRVAMRHLTHIILKKRKVEKKQAPVLLHYK